MTTLNPKTSALVLIDLQKGILGYPLTPLSGDQLVTGGKALAEKFRAVGAPVVLVNVSWAPDFADALQAPVDQPMHMEGGLPANFDELADGLAKPGDILVTKRQWGAFTGTELDLQLRRRGVRTVVVAGVSTSMGVESTVRQAWELNYEVVVAKSATTSIDPQMHEFAIGRIFPLVSRIADEISFG